MAMEAKMTLENMVIGSVEKEEIIVAPGLKLGRRKLVVAAQRLRKPRSVPRPFYRFGESVDIQLRLIAHGE